MSESPQNMTTCPPDAMCHAQLTHLTQQASDAQYRADLELQARQDLERFNSRLLHQRANLAKQQRATSDRYKQLHTAWVQSEAIRKDAQFHEHQNAQAYIDFEAALNHEKEQGRRLNRHMDRLMDSMKILAGQLYERGSERDGEGVKGKGKEKEVESKMEFGDVLLEREWLAVECELLKEEIRTLKEGSVPQQTQGESVGQVAQMVPAVKEEQVSLE